MNGNPFYEPYWSDSLEHHGTKGQKWGEKNGPPYPLSRGKNGAITKTQKKKKASFLARLRAKVSKKSSKKSKPKVEKKERTEEEKEALREKLLKSNDPKFIAKHMDLLDTKELQDRINRINTEANLKKLTQGNDKKNVDKGMQWIQNIGKVAETTTKVAAAYTATVNAKDLVEKNKRAAENEKRTAAEQRQAAKEINKILKDYGSNQDIYSDIQVEFDSKTGKLTFKSNKKK